MQQVSSRVHDANRDIVWVENLGLIAKCRVPSTHVSSVITAIAVGVFLAIQNLG